MRLKISKRRRLEINFVVRHFFSPYRLFNCYGGWMRALGPLTFGWYELDDWQLENESRK